MNKDPIRFTRDELHRIVWEKPLSQISKQFSITDVGLAKICDRHQIPRPPQGHWTRVRLGRSAPRPPLPPLDGASEILIRRDHGRRRRYERPTETLTLAVPSTLSRPDEVVQRLRRELKPAYPPERGLVVTPGPLSYAIEVAPSSADRALRILDALIKALRRRGHDVAISDQRGAALLVTCQGEAVSLALRERMTRKPHKQTAEEQRETKRRGWTQGPAYDYSKTGELRIYLARLEWLHGPRSWSDARRKPLEGKLGEVVIGIETAARAITQHKVEMEAARRRWQLEEIRYQEEARRRAEERARVEELLEASRKWEEVARTVRFLDEVERMAGGGDAPAEVRRWLEWGREVVASLNPTERVLNQLRGRDESTPRIAVQD